MYHVCPRCGKELSPSQSVHIRCLFARVWQVFKIPISAVTLLLTVLFITIVIPQVPQTTPEPAIIILASVTNVLPTNTQIPPTTRAGRSATPVPPSPPATLRSITATGIKQPLPSVTPVPPSRTPEIGETIQILIVPSLVPTEVSLQASPTTRNTNTPIRVVSATRTPRPTRPTRTRRATAVPLSETLCGGVVTRFDIGDTVVVDFNESEALRILRYYNSGPDQTLAQAYDNEELHLDNGPVCFARQWYWLITIQKATGRSYTGWAAETDPNGRPFMCPESSSECR